MECILKEEPALADCNARPASLKSSAGRPRGLSEYRYRDVARPGPMRLSSDGDDYPPWPWIPQSLDEMSMAA